MSVLPPVHDPHAPQTLATAILPRRPRRVLEHVLNTASDELERLLTAMLIDFEQQLFRLADHARKVRSLMAYVPRRYDPAIIEATPLGAHLRRPAAAKETLEHDLRVQLHRQRRSRRGP